jgi:hypothetical protein
LPQGAEEQVIHGSEGLFTGHMAMIVRPPPEERIELPDQIFWLGLGMRAHECTSFGQEEVDTGAGRFHENRAVIVAEMLTEKVKPVGDMRDLGLLGREDQAAFVEELFHERTDFGFQQFFGTAGDDEVIRESD